MQLSSIKAACSALQRALDTVDVETLSGANTTRLLTDLSVHVSKLQSFQMRLSARSISANQHIAAGAPSAASYVATMTGRSEKTVRAELAVAKTLDKVPDVAGALSSGEISIEQAAAISAASRDAVGNASELLAVARSGSVEQVNRRARELRSKQSNREQLRRKQYVRVDRGSDGLDCFEMALLPEHSAVLANALRKSQGASSWERAEAFAALLSRSAGGTQVVAHLDLTTDASGLVSGKRTEVVGVGPVPVSSVMAMLSNASLAFVGTVDNKLAFFSESDRRSTSRPLPEFVKRAVRRAAWDTCQSSACFQVVDEVDHIQPRVNDGTNAVDNLQALCRGHHRANTRQDAPWTSDKIFGRKPTPPPPTVQPAQRLTDELFPDTG